MKYEDNKLTKESAIFVTFFNHSFINWWVHYIGQGMLRMSVKDWSWEKFTKFVSDTNYNFQQWINKGIMLPEVIQIRNDKNLK